MPIIIMAEYEKKVASSQITQFYYDGITRLVRQGKYNNESDFVRQAIIEKLKREGALNES
jgi:Arc/MetJ-type ribon-helix-helix transcriptional regulator